MNFGVSSACFYPMQTEIALRNILDNGIKTIEVFINSHSEINAEFTKKIINMLNSADANIVSVHPFECPLEPMMFFTEYERRFNDSVEDYKRYFEFAQNVGAEIFVFHGDHKKSLFPNEKYYKRFAKLRDVAKEFGVIFAQENVARCKSYSTEFLVGMKEYLDGDVNFVLDTKQIIRSNASLYEFIKLLGKNIAHVHISDYVSGSDCLPLGKGELDVKKLLQKLKDEGFDKSVVVELYANNYSDVSEVYNSVEIVKNALNF